MNRTVLRSRQAAEDQVITKNHTLINGFRAHRQNKNWVIGCVVTLADIEAQILLREKLLVKFQRRDDTEVAKQWWSKEGFPRLGYSWEQALPDKATLAAFHKRMQRDVTGQPYVIIGLDGTIVSSKALDSSEDTIAKHLTMGRLRNEANPDMSTGERMMETVLGLRRLGSDAKPHLRKDVRKAPVHPQSNEVEADHA